MDRRMTASPLVERVEQAAVAIRARVVAAGGDPARVRLLAVTKGQPLAAVEAALAVGLVDIGESYAQELAAKADALADAADGSTPAPRWHFIGHLQRNKVRLIAPFVHLWQSVDRLSLAAEIAHRAAGAAVLVQVNVSGAEQQGGCPPERVAAIVEGCTDLGLEVQGLMAIGAQGTPEVVRAGFRVVRDLADQLGLPERSMGMSGDLEAAVAEGATMIRVGTALFGPRGDRPAVGT
jgi:pyridoxal phosphate enzyme (YggS family)